MALQFLKAKLSILPRIFSPTYDAIFSTLPFAYRWRLLLLQPINIITALITSPSWLFNNRYSVIYIPTRSGKKRCLVYEPPQRGKEEPGRSRPRPLHIDIHGGGFIGGVPEQGARWCDYLSNKAGAIVISLTYRIAPRDTHPAAHDDIDDIVVWIAKHAEEFNVDLNLLTVGGSSVGGTLALSAAQHLHHLSSSSTPTSNQPKVEAKAFLGFCTPTNFRLPPEQKPKPPNFPTKDPLSFLLPLFDAYARPNRQRDWDDPRLNPIIVKKERLPKDMLFVVAGIDILAHEQLVLVQRLKREIDGEEEGVVEEGGKGKRNRRVEALVIEKGFHGWLELPKLVLEEERKKVFVAGVKFIKDVHRRCGFVVDEEA